MNAQERASQWLADLDAALQRRDVDAATALFAEESYWRDLISFTWNILTSEGPAQIRQMLQATLDHVRPSNWTVEGTATEADGVTEAWFTFETAVSRGAGNCA